jgi:hypothetical protein
LWNAFLCNNDKLGLLLLQGEDDDRWDRMVSPILVRPLKFEGAVNKVNQFMDHVWDNFYAGQQRLQRFPILISGEDGIGEYELEFTGSPPKKMRVIFRGVSKKGGFIVNIPYPGSESRAVQRDDIEIPYNEWDDAARAYGKVVGGGKCGENRYEGVKNVLQFYISSQCTLTIIPRDAIQTMVRMEWTADEFFDNGGTTVFADRLAGSLGIHISTIKVVSVYEGSLVVNYEIAPTEEEPLQMEELQARQNEKFATGQVDTGAPILDVAVRKPPSIIKKEQEAAGGE